MNQTNSDTGAQGLSDQELLAATPRGRGGREPWVGFFVLIGIISGLVVLFMLTDPAQLRGRYFLVTTVSDAAGIREGDPVQMHGVNVGRTNGFEMVAAGLVHITIEIDRRWQVPVGSRTEFGAAGVFGGRTLRIVPSQNTVYHQPYDTLPGEGSVSEGLLGSVDELSAQAGSVLESIDALLNEETIGSVQGSAQALEGLLGELSAMTTEQRSALRELTESLRGAAAGLEEASAAGPDIRSAVARADSAMAQLAETGANLDAASESLRSVLARMDRGEGTLGKLSTDDALYVSLTSAAQSLNTLLEDLLANPRKYINFSLF